MPRASGLEVELKSKFSGIETKLISSGGGVYEIILDGDLSIDHVIPWSYIYSDDLWNLVFVSKSQNSSKGNRIPSEEMIEKLERRNKKLLSLLRKNNIRNNHTEELEFSIEKDLVKSNWISCKG